MTQSSILFRVLGLSLLLALTSLAVSSCINPPDYPDTPSIEFKRITKERYTNDSGTFDSVKVTVSFRDGDGDLGLAAPPQDNTPPYQELNSDGTKNRYNNNYFIQTQILRNEVYEDITINRISYDSRYPILNSSGRAEPLKGDLTFSLLFYVGSPFPRGSTIRFKVSIADRALHESNVITTDPITL